MENKNILYEEKNDIHELEILFDCAIKHSSMDDQLTLAFLTAYTTKVCEQMRLTENAFNILLAEMKQNFRETRRSKADKNGKRKEK